MRSRLAMLAFCATVACLMAVLPAAPAVGRTIAEFDVAGSDGYTAYFAFSGRTASVDAIQTPSLKTLLSAAYIAKGRLEGDRAVARFGSRGRVAVEFRPSGGVKRRLPPRRCEGEPRVTRQGVFVGAIRFTGEGSYTSVDAGRARGEVRTLPRWKCKRRGEASRSVVSPLPAHRVPLGLDPEAERFTVLAAESDDDRTSFTARAVRLQGRSGSTSFIATRLERRPSLRIVRFAFADGADETFSFDEALSSASAAPPPPFAGTATFVGDADGKVCVRYPCDRSSWLGSLSVDFPGAAGVPLAGEGFGARLFREGLDGSILR